MNVLDRTTAPARRPLRGAVAPFVLTALCALATVVAPSGAGAAVPGTVQIEGALLAGAGAPAADGAYDLSFALYAGEGAKSPAWSEGPVKVQVTGGRFTVALGSSKPLDGKLLAGLSEAWLGVQVGTDPELPRRRLHAAPYALAAARALTAAALDCAGCVQGDQLANGGIPAAKLGFNYAASSTKGGPALDLECTGCVSVSELKFDGDVDLGGNAIKAGSGTFGGDVVAKTVTATSFLGDGSKLTGIQIPSGTCSKAGEVVKGINPDGSLKCVAALDPTALPKDGLNEISNDLISNQFIDTVGADKKNIPIPDKTGAEAISNLTFPDIGTAQTFELSIHVKNTDFSKVKITLLPPNDKKVGYVLCDPCAQDDSVKELKLTYPPTSPKSGDLSAWVGKNPQGLWNLKVLDSDYCVPQKPGNASLCSVANKTDGVIADWSIKIQTLSNQKVALAGELHAAKDILAGSDIQLKGALQLSASTGACTAATKGQLRWVSANNAGLQACNGTAWVAAVSRPVVYSGYCSSHRRYSASWNYYCLDKVDANTSTHYADYLTVSTYLPPGGTNSSTSYDKYWHTNAYKTGRVTAKVAGYYRVTYKTYQRSYSVSETRVLLNGSTVSNAYQSDSASYYYHSHFHNRVVYMKVNDYLEFQSMVNADNSSAYAIYAGPTSSYVQIEFLGSSM